MSVESVLTEASIAGVRVVPAGPNLKVRGPVLAVTKWTPRLRQHRRGIEDRITCFCARIDQATLAGLLSLQDRDLAMQRCADPAAWRLWTCVITCALAARVDGRSS